MTQYSETQVFVKLIGHVFLTNYFLIDIFVRMKIDIELILYEMLLPHQNF